MAAGTTKDLGHYRFSDLAIWRTKLPGVNHGVLPPSDERPNPLVTDSVVFASIFSPGAVYALERKTGKLLWRREIPKFGGPAAYTRAGKLFAKSAHTLFAIDAVSGKVLWTFCPYGPSGETIYSSPTVHHQNLFIGDRRGFLHCLDVNTGKVRWRQRTNKAKNDDVNTTPVVTDGLVVAGTNANRAVAYDVDSGELAWVRKLDGPCGFGLSIFRGLVVAFTESIYLLEPRSGKIVRRFSWKNDGVVGATSTPKNILGILRGSWPPREETRLVAVSRSGIQFSTVHKWWLRFIRYSHDTKLAYVSHLEGIDICRPEDGRLICNIRLGEKRPEGVGLVDVIKRTIYAVTGTGRVFALRHPET
jgi:outer membrane protein assembly factor BamB